MHTGRSPEAADRGEAAPRWLLALDTSTEQAGIALSDGERTSVRSWDAGRAQTTTVLPAVDALMRESGVGMDALAAVAVAIGPGTFTGLRVGLSIAKGFVLARDLALVGGQTLEVAAAAAGADEAEVVAVLPAGRGRVVWQRFAGGRAEEPRNTTVPELVAALAVWPEALVIGELAESQRADVEAAHPHVRWEARDPAVLARIGWERWRAGDVDDPVRLEPIYLHGATVQAPPVQDRLRRRR